MVTETRKTVSLVMAVLAILAFAAMLAACVPKPKLPATELPPMPETATIKCENLTDQEVIALLERPETREAAAKGEINCAYLENLQQFVQNTWEERNGK